MKEGGDNWVALTRVASPTRATGGIKTAHGDRNGQQQ
jgi:hypothetical protein